jgi:hypothetical protein
VNFPIQDSKEVLVMLGLTIEELANLWNELAAKFSDGGAALKPVPQGWVPAGSTPVLWPEIPEIANNLMFAFVITALKRNNDLIREQLSKAGVKL